MTSSVPLDNRVALVTGAGGAIGQAIISALEDAGAVVVGADLPGAAAVELDVRDDSSCRAAVDAVLAEHGRLDLLVNNAGVMLRATALETSADDFAGVVDTNLTGTFRMSVAANAALAAGEPGVIVNVSSTHAFLAARGAVAYAASKAGVSHLTRVLALEWAEQGIRVNAVAPTVVPSAMTADVLSDPAYIERKFAAIPLGRPIEAAEVAAAVVYLAGPGAGSVTGHVLVLDGGESLA
ncbi:MAG: SDR family NAD(P)-dependent oxidoreductase [Solirubrobacteraceae bacterium]